MPGYGGQTLAMDVVPWTSQLTALAQSDAARAEADYARDSSPLRLLALERSNEQIEANTEATRANAEGQRIGNRRSEVELGTVRERAAMHTDAYRRDRISRAIGSIDPNNPQAPILWDRAMQALVDEGIEDARQFIGQYNRQRQQAWAAQYSQDASQPASVLAAGDAIGRRPPNAPEAENRYTTWTQDWDAARVNQVLGQIGPIVQGAQAVLNANDPVAELHRQAQIFGSPELLQITDPWQARAYAQSIIEQQGGMEQHLRARRMELGAGMGERPVTETIVATPDGAMIAVQPTGQGGADIREARAPAPTYSPIGYDEEGRAIYANREGQERVGTNEVETGRFGQGRANNSVFEQRRQAALDIGMSETEAVMFAGGQRPASPEQIRRMADVSARAAVAQAVAAFADGTDTQAGQDALYQRLYQERLREFSQGGLLTPDGSTPPPPPPPSSASIGQRPGQPPPARPAAPAMVPGANGQQLPAAMRSHLREGQVSRFRTPAGEQRWTLRNGQPVRLQ